MNPDQELRDRIRALADADLVRMLTVEADERPVGELLAAREEARRRSIDREAMEDEYRGIVRPPAPEPVSPSVELTAPLDTRRMASLWPWAVILPAGVAIEFWIVLQEQQGSAAAKLGLLCGSLTGFGFYLYAVYRLHALLKQATSGRYPITPGASVGMHFIPLYGFFWSFIWGAQLSRFTERHGQGQKFDRYVPGSLFLAAYALGYLDGVLRLLLLFATVCYLRVRVTRTMQDARVADVQAGDWSSSAGV